jgi:PAS domain S-box-containing protein
MSVNDEWAVDDEGLEKEVEAVCVTNENGYFLAANEIFCAMTGFTKEELLGKPCTLIMPASIASKHESYMSNYLKTGIKRLIGTLITPFIIIIINHFYFVNYDNN